MKQKDDFLSPSMLKMAGVCNEISDGNITSENITDKNVTGKNHEKGGKDGGKDGVDGKGNESKEKGKGHGSGDGRENKAGGVEGFTLRDEINAKIDKLKRKENNDIKMKNLSLGSQHKNNVITPLTKNEMRTNIDITANITHTNNGYDTKNGAENEKENSKLSHKPKRLGGDKLFLLEMARKEEEKSNLKNNNFGKDLIEEGKNENDDNNNDKLNLNVVRHDNKNESKCNDNSIKKMSEKEKNDEVNIIMNNVHKIVQKKVGAQFSPKNKIIDKIIEDENDFNLSSPAPTIVEIKEVEKDVVKEVVKEVVTSAIIVEKDDWKTLRKKQKIDEKEKKEKNEEEDNIEIYDAERKRIELEEIEKKRNSDPNSWKCVECQKLNLAKARSCEECGERKSVIKILNTVKIKGHGNGNGAYGKLHNKNKNTDSNKNVDIDENNNSNETHNNNDENNENNSKNNDGNNTKKTLNNNNNDNNKNNNIENDEDNENKTQNKANNNENIENPIFGRGHWRAKKKYEKELLIKQELIKNATATRTTTATAIASSINTFTPNSILSITPILSTTPISTSTSSSTATAPISTSKSILPSTTISTSKSILPSTTVSTTSITLMPSSAPISKYISTPVITSIKVSKDLLSTKETEKENVKEKENKEGSKDIISNIDNAERRNKQIVTEKSIHDIQHNDISKLVLKTDRGEHEGEVKGSKRLEKERVEDIKKGKGGVEGMQSGEKNAKERDEELKGKVGQELRNNVVTGEQSKIAVNTKTRAVSVEENVGGNNVFFIGDENNINTNEIIDVNKIVTENTNKDIEMSADENTDMAAVSIRSLNNNIENTENDTDRDNIKNSSGSDDITGKKIKSESLSMGEGGSLIDINTKCKSNKKLNPAPSPKVGTSPMTMDIPMDDLKNNSKDDSIDNVEKSPMDNNISMDDSLAQMIAATSAITATARNMTTFININTGSSLRTSIASPATTTVNTVTAPTSTPTTATPTSNIAPSSATTSATVNAVIATTAGATAAVTASHSPRADYSSFSSLYTNTPHSESHLKNKYTPPTPLHVLNNNTPTTTTSLPLPPSPLFPLPHSPSLHP